jgi:hypothetical protein
MKLYNFLLFISILLASNFQTQAQELFSSSVTERSKMSSEHQKIIDDFAKIKHGKSIQMVTIGDFPSLQKKGKISFTIPGTKEKITVKAVNVVAKNLRNYHWFGHIDKQFGDVNIVCVDGKTSGYITMQDGRKYQFYDAGNNKVAFLEVDLNNLGVSSCGTSDGSESKPTQTPTKPDGGRIATGCSGGSVRILAVYTTAGYNAALQWGGVVGQANQAVNDLNSVLSASGVAKSAELVGTINGEGYFVGANQLTGNIRESCIAFQNLGNTPNSALYNLREQYSADLVVLIHDNPNYGNTWGTQRTIIGIVNTHISTLNYGKNNGYALVSGNHMTDKFTFVHEVGHLLGARHQRCSNLTTDGCDDTDAIGHGFGYSSGILGQNYNYTIMHEIVGGTKIPRFSAVGIQYENCDFGDANSDNAKQILDIGHSTVNNYFGGVFANSISKQMAGSLILLTANVSCGSAPFSHNWEISYDGFNYSPWSSGQTVGFMPSCNPSSVRLTSNSSDGGQAISYYWINGTGYCGGREGVEENTEPELNQVLLQSISPNPTSGTATIEYYIPESQEVSIDLVDMRGQLVTPLLSGFHIAGQHHHAIETQPLTTGQYLIRLQSKNQQQTLKMIVSH